MLEVYSKNVTVASNASVPLDNLAVSKGCSAVTKGSSTIQFNKCGVYKVDVSAVGVAQDGGSISLQLYRNGVAQTEALSEVTASDTTSAHNLSFSTLVQVPNNNTACPCSIPTTIGVVNTGVSTVYSNINIVVTKC